MDSLQFFWLFLVVSLYLNAAPESGAFQSFFRQLAKLRLQYTSGELFSTIWPMP